MENNITLRGLVVSKFGTVDKFAKEMGWCKSKTYRIVNNHQEPNATEIRDMVQKLGIIDPSFVISIFLS